MGVRAGVCLGEEAWGLVNYVWGTIKLRIGYLRHACISKLLKGLTYICTYSVHIILFGRAKKDAFLHYRFPSSLQPANNKHVRSFHFKNRSERAITHLTFTELIKLLLVVSQISCYSHLHIYLFPFTHSPIHNEIADFWTIPLELATTSIETNPLPVIKILNQRARGFVQFKKKNCHQVLERDQKKMGASETWIRFFFFFLFPS